MYNTLKSVTTTTNDSSNNFVFTTKSSQNNYSPIVPPPITMVIGSKSSPFNSSSSSTLSRANNLSRTERNNLSTAIRMEFRDSLNGSFGSITVPSRMSKFSSTTMTTRTPTTPLIAGSSPGSIVPFADSASRIQIQQYLHTVSGQLRIPTIIEIEHNYSKPYHFHPDPMIKSHAAKFLFMKHFPQHLSRLANHQQQNGENEDVIDVLTYEEVKKIPFLTPKPPTQPMVVEDDLPDIDQSILDGWNCEKTKLWTRATKIIHSDRMSRLSFEGNANEVLLKRNLQENTANRFRELFASTFWDFKLISWLHETLMTYLESCYQAVYVESLLILKQKIPTLIDKFYQEKKQNYCQSYQQSQNHTDARISKIPSLNDPLFNTLSHYKPKKLPRKPIFILVPSGPNQSPTPSPRLKYWISLLSSMGKLVQLAVQAKPTDFITDILNEIRCLVNEKIRSCKNSFSNRPLVLVGFNSGSAIAAHCALQNPKAVSAVICLGFPLKTINGCRGELGDTLLELSCPIQFVIGENAVMSSLDDIEDFRERMTKTETSLVVVGGADDKLVVSNMKKRLECLTQSMVDRCILDEIASFLQPILMSYSDQLDSVSFNLNDNSRIFKFHEISDGDSSGLLTPGMASNSTLITSSMKRKSRKRSNSDRSRYMIGIDGRDSVFTQNNSGSMVLDKILPKRRRNPTSRSPRSPKSSTNNDLASKMANNQQPGTSNGNSGNLTPGPNFAWVPFHQHQSADSGSSTPNTAPAILGSSYSVQLPTTETSTQKPSMFTTIKIEKSQISIDNQQILQPLSQFSKKIVKKAVSGTNTPVTSSPTNSISITNLSRLNLNNLKQSNQLSSSSSSGTTTAIKNSTSSGTTPVLANAYLQNRSTTTTTTTMTTGLTECAKYTDTHKKDSTTIPSGTELPSTSIHNSTSRTGRQIKPPKTLVDF